MKGAILVTFLLLTSYITSYNNLQNSAPPKWFKLAVETLTEHYPLIVNLNYIMILQLQDWYRSYENIKGPVHQFTKKKSAYLISKYPNKIYPTLTSAHIP